MTRKSVLEILEYDSTKAILPQIFVHTVQVFLKKIKFVNQQDIFKLRNNLINTKFFLIIIFEASRHYLINKYSNENLELLGFKGKFIQVIQQTY